MHWTPGLVAIGGVLLVWAVVAGTIAWYTYRRRRQRREEQAFIQEELETLNAIARERDRREQAKLDRLYPTQGHGRPSMLDSPARQEALRRLHSREH
jgi:hypothetical protein